MKSSMNSTASWRILIIINVMQKLQLVSTKTKKENKKATWEAQGPLCGKEE
jgi:hypothetical protein